MHLKADRSGMDKMITRLRSVKQFLAPPVFADEEKTRAARTLNAVLVLVFVVVGLYFIVIILFSTDTFSIILAAIMTLLPVGLWILMRRGHVQRASILLSTALMIAVTLAVYSSGGIRAPITSAYLIGIAVAGLLVSTQAAIGMVALATAALVVLSQAEISGQLSAYSPVGPLQLATYLGTFSVVAVLLSLSTRNAREALDRAHHRERAPDAGNRALQALRASLEQRVAERTVQLQISAEVGRAAAAILDQNQLLREVVALITEGWGFFYPAAFLLDENGKSAVLWEPPGKAGQALKERGHSLEVGG